MEGLQRSRRNTREPGWMGNARGAEHHLAHTRLKAAQEWGCSLLPEVPAQRCGPTPIMAITRISPDPAPLPALADACLWCFSFLGPHTKLYAVTVLKLEAPWVLYGGCKLLILNICPKISSTHAQRAQAASKDQLHACVQVPTSALSPSLLLTLGGTSQSPSESSHSSSLSFSFNSHLCKCH